VVVGGAIVEVDDDISDGSNENGKLDEVVSDEMAVLEDVNSALSLVDNGTDTLDEVRPAQLLLVLNEDVVTSLRLLELPSPNEALASLAVM
jgi:hypothetical protein